MSPGAAAGAFILCGLVATGCGPGTVWYGHSPDRRTRVDVLAQGEHQFIELRGASSPLYDGVSIDALVFSPDSRRLAYAAQRDDAWVLVIDGVESRFFAGIGEVVFSPDSRRIAYAVEQRGRWHVVLDGRAGPAFDAILRGSLRFSPNSQRFGYVAERHGATRVTIDGVESAAYDGIGRLTFSPDGHKVAFLARIGAAAHAVIDGAISPPYMRITDLFFGPDGQVGYIATRRDGQTAVIGSAESAVHDQVTGLRASAHGWAYVVKDGDAWSVVRDGIIGARHDRVDIRSLRFSPDGQHLAYAAARGASWYMVIDGRELGPHDAVEPAQFAARGPEWGYIAHTGAASVVVIGDAHTGALRERRERWAGNLRLSASGARHGYLAQRGDARSVIIDDVAYDFELVVDGTLMFSDDDRHWACVAAIDGSGQFSIVIDGRARAPFDLVEVMVLMAGDPFGMMLSPETEDKVRAIVAAEVERLLADDLPRADVSEHIPVIALAARQPTPAVSRFAPAGALALGASLEFVTADGGLGAGAIQFTDLALVHPRVRYALSGQREVFAGVTLLPKQPATAAEWLFQGGHVGAALAVARGHAQTLSLSGRWAGGPLLAGAGWWTDLQFEFSWRRRFGDALIGQVSAGASGARYGLADGAYFMASGAAGARLLVHAKGSRIAAWAGGDYSLPVAWSLGDPQSGAVFDPGHRVGLEAGLALAIAHRWHLLVRLRAIDRGERDAVSVIAPTLDGGFDQRQLSFGVMRLYGVGARSPALAASSNL